jgi:hypothetical protein
MNRIIFTKDDEGDVVSICSDEPIELYMAECDDNGTNYVFFHEGVDVGSELVEAALQEHPISHCRERRFGKLPAGMPPGYAYHVTKAWAER